MASKNGRKAAPARKLTTVIKSASAAYRRGRSFKWTK